MPLRRHLSKIISILFPLFLVGGIIELYIASLFVRSKAWGGGSWPGPIWDSWGVEIGSGFFLHRDLALCVLVAASLLYPFRIWTSNTQMEKSSSSSLDFNIYAGLLLPSVIVFGFPGGIIYGSPVVEFGVTGIVTPIYNFFFTGIYTIDSRIVLNGIPSPFAGAGLLFFVLGLIQIVSLKGLLSQRIGINLFLLPILANLVVSFLIFGCNVIPLWTIVGYNIPNLAMFCVPTPILSVGVLVRGYQEQSTMWRYSEMKSPSPEPAVMIPSNSTPFVSVLFSPSSSRALHLTEGLLLLKGEYYVGRCRSSGERSIEAMSCCVRWTSSRAYPN